MHGRELRVDLGQKIQTLRKARGWTQAYLAEQIGLHRAYVADVERGFRNISFDNLLKFAEAFEMTFSGLCENIGRPNPGNQMAGELLLPNVHNGSTRMGDGRSS